MHTNQLISQVNLSINADWNKIRSAYRRIIENKNAGKYQLTKEPAYDSVIYSLGTFGYVISSTSLTDGVVWDVWGGKMLESLLPPGLLALRDEMRDSGLNFINFDYFQHTGNVTEHIDGKRLDENSIDGHCNINYIVSAEDPNARTFARNDHCSESYDSIPGTAWILDTGTYHKINNSGFREILQLRVYSAHEKIKEFFQNRSIMV